MHLKGVGRTRFVQFAQCTSNLRKCTSEPWGIHPQLKYCPAKRFIFCISWKISPLATSCYKITGTSSHISQRFQHEERGSQNDTLCDVRLTTLLFYHRVNWGKNARFSSSCLISQKYLEKLGNECVILCNTCLLYYVQI